MGPDEVNKKIAGFISAQEPFMVARYGGTEMNMLLAHFNREIFHRQADEEQYKKSLAKIKKNVEPFGIKELDEKGKKKLAYSVGKNNTGYFVVLEIRATEQEILEIERYYRVNSDILKFMSVRKYRR